MATVITVGALGYALTRPHTHEPSQPRPLAPPSTSVVAATPTPSRPALPHDQVAAAVPVGFRISGPAFTITAAVCQMHDVRPLDPPGDQLHTVCWVSDRTLGVPPGSASRGTSYILGHAWAQAQLVFNPLSEFAMHHVASRPRVEGGVATYPVSGLTGYEITLRTQTGVLTYRVHTAYTVAKMDAARVPSLMAMRTPNRVVLITCGVKDGVDVDVNVIVYAYLTASRRA